MKVPIHDHTNKNKIMEHFFCCHWNWVFFVFHKQFPTFRRPARVRSGPGPALGAIFFLEIRTKSNKYNVIIVSTKTTTNINLFSTIQH